MLNIGKQYVELVLEYGDKNILTTKNSVANKPYKMACAFYLQSYFTFCLP